MHIRPATGTDAVAVMALLDDAVAWLVAHGRSGQWGNQPWSANPAAAARVRQRIADGLMHVAEAEEGRLLGAIALEPEPAPYLAAEHAVDEPEFYITNFVSSRAADGRGIGRLLLAHARGLAAADGVKLLRLDCYAGGDGALIRYYEGAGFTSVCDFWVRFTGREPWPGRLMQQRLEP